MLKVNHRDHPHSSEMESDEYHQISTQLKHTAAKINKQLLSLRLQDKTITPSEKASNDLRDDEYEYDDVEVQLKVVMPSEEGNSSQELVNLSVGDRISLQHKPQEKSGISGIFHQKGLIDLRPDFWKINDKLRTWAGSGTQPDGFYYDYSHLAKIMNVIIYRPRQKQFVQIKEG